MLGLGSEVLELGSKDLGLGSEVLGLGSEVLGFGSKVLGLGSQVLRLDSEVLGLDSEDLGLGSEVLGLGPEVLGLGSRVLGVGCEIGARLRGFGPGLRGARVQRFMVSGLGFMVSVSEKNLSLNQGWVGRQTTHFNDIDSITRFGEGVPETTPRSPTPSRRREAPSADGAKRRP